MDARSVDRSHGRVQILDGRLVYSPNCQRAVSIPTRNPEVPENIFLPPVSKDGKYDFASIQLSTYQKPRWWSEHWGWTSCISYRPTFKGDILRVLAHLPLAQDIFEREDPSRYYVSPSIVRQWSSLEGDLYRITHHLSVLTRTTIVKPVMPWVFGYKKTHVSRSNTLYSAERSRDWFVVWMGIVAYLIAKATAIEKDLKAYPSLSILAWKDYLILKCCDPTWLDAFSLSEACTYAKGMRTGAFVDFLRNQESQPSIDWFYQFEIPIWYIWDSDLAKDPRAENFAPLSHQLQEASTSISLQPSMPPIAAQHHASNVPFSSCTGSTSWDIFFFAMREKRNRRLAEHETTEKRKARSQRERNPPTKGVKVFIWEADDSGCLIRQLVDPQDRIETLAMYSSDQVRYDSFANEYDCCKEFGPGTGYNPTDYFESGEDPLEIAVPVDEICQDYNDLLQAPRSTLSSVYDYNASTTWLPSHCVPNDQLLADKTELEILKILRTHFGYTPPLLTPTIAPITAVADQKNFLKVIGIAWKACPSEVFTKARIVMAFDFIRRLCSKAAITDDEWDLSRSHRETIVFSTRIKSIRKARSTAPLVNTYYMFDFGSSSKKDWKLAVTSASDAVMVCRLDFKYDEVDIAYFLLQHGIPFHTFAKSPSPSSYFDSPIIPNYPFRPEKHSFNMTDYAVYIQRSAQLLNGPCGRMALMNGGYLWRIAMPIVGFEDVFSGPIAHTRKFLTVITEQGKTYIDNQLTQGEIDILSGVYYCKTGQGDQIAKKSWYPLVSTYQHSGHDYGRWTLSSEMIFDIFGTQNSAATQGSSSVQKQPLSANKWRDAICGSGDLRRARLRLEEVSSSLIIGS